ncbi:PGF-CTERM sorting domain-containing protein [Haloglomus litoreum]|uniref:PGF-CTERM sorting domain-containing protein n=1 Tax=Haloglomus litoreum TaxID=3034026 RepID=UPI0023E7DF1B|nr:PGF-CTERM sorting domain-containing protein [Haloglomus sp. DT116]
MQRAVLLSVLLLVAAAAPFVGTAAATQEQVTLDVQVVNEAGDPVSGATVNATWDGGSRTETTTSSGRTLIDVPRGEDVRLTISDDTYVRNFPKIVTNAEAQDVTIEVARKGSATLTFTEEGSTPVENATVFIRSGQRVVVRGETNANGRFSSGTIEQDDYTLIFRKDGYFRNETSLSVPGSVIRSYEMRRGTVNAEFRVVDDHFDDPRPVSDAAVTLEGIGTQRTTNGRVTFTVPVNTQQQVEVTKEGYRTVELTATIGEGSENVRVTIQRTPKLNLTADSTRVLVGNRVGVSVLNAYDEPVNGATIRFDGERLGQTGSDGRFRFRVDSTGNHTLEASTASLTSDPVIIRGVEVDESTPTATPTATATPTETPTETAAETPTATPAVGLPGFTPAVAVLGLLLAALLFRRRD